MTKLEHIEYWTIGAEKNWVAVHALFDKGSYPEALFFAHLVLEKLLKAHWVQDSVEDYPPRIHNLVRLSEQTNLNIDVETETFLGTMNFYQMEGRYSDHRVSIYSVATKERTESLLIEVNTLRQWLISKL